MEEIINKYQSQLDFLNERLNTAIFIGEHQRIRIETEKRTLEHILADLRTFTDLKSKIKSEHILQNYKPCQHMFDSIIKYSLGDVLSAMEEYGNTLFNPEKFTKNT